ncbi:hypothetical protein OG400_29360 [Micromonospora ureilytica]|uniref:caspase family protein n=1 Tax=Micromonospora ureilytica TaxID=709868 RepID=UPI002E131401|nr:hypothetical protein OG400_29360 [Micromonospora ureilytica]
MTRTALLIGASTYDDPDLAPLSAPLADVERFAALLRDPMIGFFDRVEVLLNRPSHELLGAIEELSTGGGFDDLLLLYLSCHGVVDHQRGGALYFAASNTQSNRLASTSVPARYVNEQFAHATARSRVLLLDCCFSGRFAEGFGSKSDVDPLRDVAGGGYVVITASDSVGVAYEESRDQRSVFTDVLVEGLRTGDADCDADGVVSTNDLFDYAAPRVRARHAQTPQYLATGVDGKVILARAAGLDRADSSDAPARPPRDWPATVADVAAGLHTVGPAADIDPDQWPEDLFGGVCPAAAGLLAWRADMLPAVVAAVIAAGRDAAATTTPTPTGPGPTDAWRALLNGWWEDAQTQFAIATREQPMLPVGWWGTGLSHAATGAYGRAAEAFARAARYTGATHGRLGKDASEGWMRRIPVTSRTIDGGAALLAAAAREFAGVRQPAGPPNDATQPVCTELRILNARQSGDPVRLAEALTADPAAALLAIALHPGTERPPLLSEALRAACDGLGQRARELIDAWAQLRQHAWRANVDVPELLAKIPADPADLDTVLAGHWRTISTAEQFATEHGAFIVKKVNRACPDEDAATRVATLITRIERDLLPATERATLLPYTFLGAAYAMVDGADGVVGYPTLDQCESLGGGGPDRIVDEEELRAYLARPVMTRATLAAWLAGDLPRDHHERPGAITGAELAELMLGAGITTIKHHPAGRFGRRREVDAGWLLGGSSDSRAETSWAQTTRYLMPDGTTRIEYRSGSHANSSHDEETLPPDHQYAAGDLTELRQNLAARRAEQARRAGT